MPVSARTLGLLLDAGLNGDQLRAVVASIDTDQSPLTDSVADRRRAYDRERKRNVRGLSTGQNANISTGHSTGFPPETGPSRVRDITSNQEDTGKKETKNLVVDLDFEAVWRAYPHRKGRSSKPKALIAWKALSKEYRSAMLAAVKRYADEGLEPKADCGAKAFELWLRDHRFLDWMPMQAIPPPIRTPADLDAQAAYVALCEQRMTADGP